MSTIERVYIESNCNFAYQLRWGLTIFWQKSVDEKHWFEALVEHLAPQGIRILSWRWKRANVSQFSLSTVPIVSPSCIIEQVRECLQSICERISPSSLRTRFAIRSFGTQERKIVEAYVAKQPSHHPMASASAQELFESLVFKDTKVDLSISRNANGGIYWYNLHVALVNTERWRCANREWLVATRDAIVRTSTKKRWQLSCLALLADHLHFSIGCSLEESPSQVVLSVMNNIAWMHGMKPVLCYSAFMGTFGEYDQRSVLGRQRGMRE